VPSTVPKNIVELRRVLAEKFPGVKMSAGPRATLSKRWATGLANFDAVLDGGLAKSAITELMSGGVASGGSLLLAGLIRQARRNGEWLALIDATDSFDPAALHNQTLQRLLWIRCAQARDAIKAADLILHDGSAAVTVLDLAFCAPQQVRRISSSTWFRLERLVENSSTAFLVMTPEPMVTNAEIRLRLERKFPLEALDQPQETLLAQIAPETVKSTTRIVKIA
jgi:hypothetical protein